jgi:hypothetical protein
LGPDPVNNHPANEKEEKSDVLEGRNDTDEGAAPPKAENIQDDDVAREESKGHGIE